MSQTQLKGIVSWDFSWLQIILMNKLGVPDVPLEVYFFFLSFSYSFLNLKFWQVKLLLTHLAKA